jgi:hypothetical protein
MENTMKRILTSIALIASLGTAQAAGPEDVLLGVILGGFIGNSMAKQAPVVVQQPPVIVQQPPVVIQQPQVIYQPLPPQPVCRHMPVYNSYGQFLNWHTYCR